MAANALTGEHDVARTNSTLTLAYCKAFALHTAPGVTYLNAASRTPMLRRVYDVGVEAVGRKLLPWRIDEEGGHAAAEVRLLFARLLGAERADVALTPSCSYAVTVAARSLRAAGRIMHGTELLVLQDQMSSNVYPWQAVAADAGARVRVVARPADGDWSRAVCEALSAGRTAVAALPNVHWCDGAPLDLRRIGAACADARAALVVDATQSLGALPLDARHVRADFVVASTHKYLLGPYGCCPLYAAPEWHASATPIEAHERSRAGAAGGRDVPFALPPPPHVCGAGAPYDEAYAPGACRLDSGGRPNPILLPMVAAGLRQVLEWTPEAIGGHAAALCARLAAWAAREGYALPGGSKQHLLGLRRPTRSADGWSAPAEHAWAEDLARALRERHGVHVSGRFGALRVAPHVYNCERDIDALIAALEAEAALAPGAAQVAGDHAQL